jgi:hypothetical protein
MYLFSTDPTHVTWRRPSSVSQRYSRMCASLGWDVDVKDLRYYSATELIAAGVDVRTVAGRLGHGGGGATTLRVYSAWRPEADQRAARTVSDRLPPSARSARHRAISGPTQLVPRPGRAGPIQPVASDRRRPPRRHRVRRT